jgi:hypothetical protein
MQAIVRSVAATLAGSMMMLGLLLSDARAEHLENGKSIFLGDNGARQGDSEQSRHGRRWMRDVSWH